eukprot:SAG11_NODE_1799_length_4244_cov_2.524005_3_plen_101_part_00
MSEASETLGLSEEQLAYYQLASDFAAEQMLPHAEEWDRDKVFPAQVRNQSARATWLRGGPSKLCTHGLSNRPSSPPLLAALYRILWDACFQSTNQTAIML